MHGSSQRVGVLFVEGRLSWGKVVRASKDWSRITATYFPGELKKKAARYIQARRGAYLAAGCHCLAMQ